MKLVKLNLHKIFQLIDNKQSLQLVMFKVQIKKYINNNFPQNYIKKNVLM